MMPYQVPTSDDIERFAQAVREGLHPRIVAELEKFGPHIANAEVNDGGLTALLCADTFNTATYSVLLAYGANPNITDGDGITPLMNAASCLPKAVALIPMLGASGADVNMQCKKGFTALMYAAHDAKKVQALLDLGADPFLKNAKDQTALDLTRGVAESEKLIHEAMQKTVMAETATLQQQLQRIPKSILKKKI